MKKTARKLMCLALVMLLVATMAVPAMAKSEGTGKWNGYTYDWYVECGNTHGIAQISSSGKPTYVKAYAECTLYYEEEKAYGISYSGDPVSCYVTASVTAKNTFTYEGREVTGTIKKTFGKFWVESENVVPGVYAYPD